MKAKNKFLSSKVARRIFTLFIACALVPVILLTTVSLLQVSNQLKSQNERQLQQGAKSLGLAVFERLTILDSELQVAALRARQGNSRAAEVKASHFGTIAVYHHRTGSAPHSTLPFLQPEEIRHLATGKSLVRVNSCSGQPAQKCVLVIRLIDPEDASAGFIVGEVSPSYLWSSDRLPADLNLDVLDASQEVLFNSDPGMSPETIPPREKAWGVFQWVSHGTVYDAAYRDLFLNADFLAGKWTIVLSQNHREAFAPTRQFQKTLLLVVLLAVWTVILLSLIQIRRTTGPLEKLSQGTRQIAEQNFNARVEISSGDEFQDLATSFNSMSSRLGKQFHTLRAINEIDQAILSSLNRESVISTALSKMAGLLPSQSFAIGIFQPDSSESAWVQITVQDLRSNSQRTMARRSATRGDLQRLQEARSVHIRLESEGSPDFLQPLRDLGMRSATLFGISLENRIFATLICGQLSAAPMSPEDIHHAIQVADQLAVAFSNVQLIEALEQLHWGTLTALARAIDAKSAWTAGHSERVTRLALKIGSAMGLSSRDLQTMQRGGLLHDVGKIGTAPEVLDKPGKLDPQEMQVMRDHVRIGVRILEPIGAFTEALPIVAQHHEWFNGGGYPEGLAGEQISLHARIFAVADCYDAMVSDRPYRKGMPKEQVVEMLKQKSGIQFDPGVIEVFARIWAEDESLHRTKDSVQLVEQLT